MADERSNPIDPSAEFESGGPSGAETGHLPEQTQETQENSNAISSENSAGSAGSVDANGVPVLAAFRRLNVPTPPMLEEAIGYGGEARFIAFYWGGGDECYYADGRISATADWEPYLLFVRHRAVWPDLIGYDFGSSDRPARHYLLLDRRLRILYAAPARAAGQFLEQQWPAPSPEELAIMDMIERLTPEDWARISADLTAQMNDMMQQQIAEDAALPHVQREVRWVAKAASQHLRHEELRAWLDALPDDERAAALTRQCIQTMIHKSARERQERDHEEDQPPDLQPPT